MTSLRDRSRLTIVIGGIVATLVLAGLSIVAVGQLGGGWRSLSDSSCAVPAQSGPVVNVTVTNMGSPMMGGSTGMMSVGSMRLVADTATVRRGTVTFLVSNRGSVSHEMLILPLRGSQLAGTGRSAGTAGSMKREASAKHRVPAGRVPAMGSCPVLQAG